MQAQLANKEAEYTHLAQEVHQYSAHHSIQELETLRTQVRVEASWVACIALTGWRIVPGDCHKHLPYCAVAHVTHWQSSRSAPYMCWAHNCQNHQLTHATAVSLQKRVADQTLATSQDEVKKLREE